MKSGKIRKGEKWEDDEKKRMETEKEKGGEERTEKERR